MGGRGRPRAELAAEGGRGDASVCGRGEKGREEKKKLKKKKKRGKEGKSEKALFSFSSTRISASLLRSKEPAGTERESPPGPTRPDHAKTPGGREEPDFVRIFALAGPHFGPLWAFGAASQVLSGPFPAPPLARRGRSRQGPATGRDPRATGDGLDGSIWCAQGSPGVERLPRRPCCRSPLQGKCGWRSPSPLSPLFTFAVTHSTHVGTHTDAWRNHAG